MVIFMFMMMGSCHARCRGCCSAKIASTTKVGVLAEEDDHAFFAHPLTRIFADVFSFNRFDGF